MYHLFVVLKGDRMKEDKIFKAIVCPGFTDPKGDEVLELLDNGNIPEGFIKIKYEEDEALTKFYLVKKDQEDPSDETCIGSLQEVTDKESGEVYPDTFIEEIKYGYKAVILGKGEEDYQIILEVTSLVPETEDVTPEAAGSSIDDQINRIIKDGIWTKEETEEHLAYFRACDNVNDDLIAKALLKVRNHKFRDFIPNPRMKFKDYSNIMRTMIDCVILGIGIYVKGNKGTGKNTALKTLCWLFHMPYFEVIMGRNTDDEGAFGSKVTKANAFYAVPSDTRLKWAKSYMDYTSGRKADAATANEACNWMTLQAGAPVVEIEAEQSQFVMFLEDGGLFHIDEANMMDPNMAAKFNSVNDGSEFMDVPYHGRMAINPDCILGASCNPGYAGSMKGNDASEDRYVVINFPNPNKEQIEQIFMRSARDAFEVLKDDDTHSEYFSRAAASYSKMLKAVTENMISDDKCLSIRQFCNALRMKALHKSEMTLMEALQITVKAHCNEHDQATLQGLIDEIGI